MKQLLRNSLVKLGLGITKNLSYDIQLKKVISRHLSIGSNSIDVGCHKGEILDLFLEASPNGKHYGFEPIPSFYNELLEKYKGKASILNCALSSAEGQKQFHFIKSNPAYSGFKKRELPSDDEVIEQLNVQCKRLDSFDLPPIDMIKIDVEGAELEVMLGAEEVLKKDRPLLVFEHGLGGSDIYNTYPKEIWNYLVKECGYDIYLMKSWLADKASLSFDEFNTQFEEKTNYYFLAQVVK